MWEVTGRRRELQTTWDPVRNANCGRFHTGSRGVPRGKRFDRMYFSGRGLRSADFGLAGLERVPGHQCFPSDHWAILGRFYFTTWKNILRWMRISNRLASQSEPIFTDFLAVFDCISWGTPFKLFVRQNSPTLPPSQSCLSLRFSLYACFVCVCVLYDPRHHCQTAVSKFFLWQENYLEHMIFQLWVGHEWNTHTTRCPVVWYASMPISLTPVDWL